jgi:hypothetical protein
MGLHCLVARQQPEQHMSNTQTRHWLIEHFYAALRIDDLAATVNWLVFIAMEMEML